MPLTEFPCIRAITRIALHDSSRGGGDLLGLLQGARGHPLLERLQLPAGSVHRLSPQRLLGGAPFVGIDDDPAHPGDPGRDSLRPRARRVRLSFPGVDAHRTVDPLGLGDGIEPPVQRRVAPPLGPDEEPPPLGGECPPVRFGDPAPIADEDEPLELEPLAEVGDGVLPGAVVEAIAGPGVRGDRPARDHHHADDDLDVVRRAVPAGAVVGEVHRPCPLEGGAGEVGEHQLRLEAEEVAGAVIEGHFDPVRGGDELIAGAIPGVPLPGRDADPSARVPVGDEAPALAIGDEVGFEPAGPPVLAGGGAASMGDEDKGPVGDGDAVGFAERCIADRPEAERIERGAESEDGSPGRGLDDRAIGRRSLLLADVPTEQSLELGEDLEEETFAAEIGDDALLNLSAFAVGFDDADGFVECVAAGADLDSSQVDVVKYHDTKSRKQAESAVNLKRMRVELSLHFGARKRAPM